MATAGSMKETLKALTSTFSAPTVPTPLPDELQHTIDAFLDKYHDAEQYDAQRFHDELLSLYNRHVAGNPEKRTPFLSALRRVRPALTGEARSKEWWALLIQPTLENIGSKRHEIEEARGFLLDILAYDADEDKEGKHARLSKSFSAILIQDYLDRTTLPSDSTGLLSPEGEFVSHELETTLVSFGRHKPKDFLLALDELFVQRKHRFQILNLLGAYVRQQPPHLYCVLDTPLIEHLEKCLLIDTSCAVVELALMILIMFLPHITSSLTSEHHVARLFLIYSRLLCWDKFAASQESRSAEAASEGKEHSGMEEDSGDEFDQAWEKLQESSQYPNTSSPSVAHYFTFLYGLFPLNFMSFLRKPRKYLKKQNFPDAEDFDIDQDLIHTRTEPHRKVHLLHPYIFRMTIEDELAENPWLKADPADIVTECMDLCLAFSASIQDPGPPPTSRLPSLPGASVPEASSAVSEGNNSWRNTQSTVIGTPAPGPSECSDAPPEPTSSVPSHDASPLLRSRDIMDSPTLPPVAEAITEKTLDGSPDEHQHLDAQAHSLAAFAHAVTYSTEPSTHPEFQNQGMSALQREIMLLRNDLNFERYLKQQHLAHIGELQRRHIKEATNAAETQNLINHNRTLKAKLAKANELYAQLKKETLTSRSQSKKWEVELSSKVKAYREDQKVWQNEEEQLRYDLKKSQQDYEHLKRMVEKAEAELLRTQQKTRALEIELEDFNDLRRELEGKQNEILKLQDQSKDMEMLLRDREELRNDLEVANMRLKSRETERERSIQAYERRIYDLESRLQATERSPPKTGQLPASVQQMLDSALAANNAKLQQLRKIYQALLEKHTDLELRHNDLEAQLQAERGGFPSPPNHGSRSPESSGGLARNFSFRQPTYESRYSSIDEAGNDDSNHHRSPASTSPTQLTRPVRLESLHSKRSANTLPFVQSYYGPYESLNRINDDGTDTQLQSPPSTSGTVQSSGKSGISVETSSSKGEKKEKVAPNSEVRIYGRGGAQNIGKKIKDEDKKKDKEPKKSGGKTGGFRGLRGIM